MDFYNNDSNGNMYQGYGRIAAPDPHVRLATIAMILGIIGIVFGIQVFGLPFSGVAIILALLSRGDRPQLEPRAKTAVILGAVGLVVGIITTVVITYSAFRVLPQLLQTPEFHQAMEQFYGEQTDEVIELLEEQYPMLTQQ